MTAEARIAAVRRALLVWYDANRRDLPWRRTRDPYAIWLSEVMLQQTRVETVIPYYERFLARFPTVETLALADPEDVRAAWSGLGYYRRAEQLMRAASVVVDRHGGALPGSYDELLGLPGFGPYTAGAVAAIAYDREVPAIDGNANRVLGRIEGIGGDPLRGPAKRRIGEVAAALARGPRSGDLVQAIMELGATVCGPRSWDCGGCPVSAECRARAEGTIAEIPPPKARAARPKLELTALVLTDGEAVWLERRGEAGLFARLWCVPLLEAHLEPGPSLALAGELVHVLTHRELVVRVLRGGDPGAREGRWVPLDRLDAHGLPALALRALAIGLGAGAAALWKLQREGAAPRPADPVDGPRGRVRDAAAAARGGPARPRAGAAERRGARAGPRRQARAPVGLLPSGVDE